MVGIGEFSPNNPKLYKDGKPTLGLGEYEEARKKLLEQDRKEKKAADKKAKKKSRKGETPKKKQRIKETAQVLAEAEGDPNKSDDDESSSTPSLDSSDEAHSDQRDAMEDSPSSFSNKNQPLTLPTHPEFSQLDSEMVEELKRWEQEKYKEELDEQIREKERLRREAEEAEQREEEERDRIFREQTRKLQEEYERELNSRRFFVWQRRKRAEVLKKRLEQLEREDEERRRLKRLERQRRGRRAVLSQGNIFTDDVTFTDRLKARSLSPSLLSYPIPRNLYPHKTDPLYHRFTPPITPKPWLRGGPDTLIIDAPHDLSVKPKVGIAPLLVDPNAVPLPLPKVHHRSRRLQEPDSAKSYKLVGESNSPYGFHRSKRILTQLGQFRKQLQFGNKLRNF